MVGQGSARHGKARDIRQGVAWLDAAWQGAARRGKVRLGLYGMARHGEAWRGMVGHGTVRIIRCGKNERRRKNGKQF